MIKIAFYTQKFKEIYLSPYKFFSICFRFVRPTTLNLYECDVLGTIEFMCVYLPYLAVYNAQSAVRLYTLYL